MKRIKVITAIITVITMFIVMPFSVIKADTITTSQNGTFSKGNWTTTFVLADSSSDYLDLSPYGQTDTNRYYRSGVVIHVGMNNKYSGSITIKFSGDVSSYALYFTDGEGVGNYTFSASAKTMTLILTECNSFNLYMFSSAYSTSPAAQVSSISDSLTVVPSTASLIDSIADYWVSPEVLSGWLFACEDHNNVVDMVYGRITPFIWRGPVAGEESSRVWIPGGESRYYYFYGFTYTGKVAASAFYLESSGNFSLSVDFIDGSQQTWGLYRITITNNDNQEWAVKLRYNSAVFHIPLYYGNGENMSQEMQMITHHESESLITKRLTSILDAINATSDSPVDQNISDQAGTLTDLHDQESHVSDSVNSDFTDFQNNVDLNDYNFVDSITDSSSYFKMVLTDVFSETAPIRAFWIIPVICVVLLALLGG